MAAIEPALVDALERYDVACVLLTCTDDATFDADWANRIRTICQDRDTAFLNEIRLRQDVANGADGVHIEADPELYRHFRQVLGKNAIIGTHCETRHDAMLLAELGSDYVAFKTKMQSMRQSDQPDEDLIGWWAQTFVVPCVAWNVEDAAEAEQAAEAGADFVAITKKCFESPDGAALLAAIAGAVEKAQ